MRAASDVMSDVLWALRKLRRSSRDFLGESLWLEAHGIIEGAEMGFCANCGELYPADKGCPHAPYRCGGGEQEEPAE